MSLFKKAERKQAFLKIALTGPSGSGKTYSALRLAGGLAAEMKTRVAVIDTEAHSASLYSEHFDFDCLEVDPPYTVQKYEQAINGAIKEGYKVVVVDSISHQWDGEGGILDKKARMDSAGGNSFRNWAKLTPDQERFRSLILQSHAHLICTMRSKQEYVIQQNDRGRAEIKKVGMAPIQRNNFEYDFTSVIDIDIAHQATASKDRTGLFDGLLEKISEDLGKKLYAWHIGGKELTNEELLSRAPIKPLCEQCGEIMPLHPSGKGFACPNWSAANDGHSKIVLEKLDDFLAKQVAKPTTKTDIGGSFNEYAGH